MPKLPQSLPLLETLPVDPGVLARGARDMYQRIAGVINNPDFGATSARPTATATEGQFYLDTTLGKPIWRHGSVWIDATGATV